MHARARTHIHSFPLTDSWGRVGAGTWSRIRGAVTREIWPTMTLLKTSEFTKNNPARKPTHIDQQLSAIMHHYLAHKLKCPLSINIQGKQNLKRCYLPCVLMLRGHQHAGTHPLFKPISIPHYKIDHFISFFPSPVEATLDQQDPFIIFHSIWSTAMYILSNWTGNHLGAPYASDFWCAQWLLKYPFWVVFSCHCPLLILNEYQPPLPPHSSTGPTAIMLDLRLSQWRLWRALSSGI
jgi:hypothetical protein